MVSYQGEITSYEDGFGEASSSQKITQQQHKIMRFMQQRVLPVFIPSCLPLIALFMMGVSGVSLSTPLAYAVLGGLCIFSAFLCVYICSILLKPVDHCVEMSRQIIQSETDQYSHQDIIGHAFTHLQNQISELKAQLNQSSLQDELSGIMNRKAFLKRASEEVARSRRTSMPLALMLIDIDCLKKVNDLHGHGVGDLLIKDIAELIQNEIRQYDILARIEGEEFALLMPNVEGQNAKLIAERLRTYVLCKKICEVEGRPVTISVGVTEHLAHEPWIEISMGRAERALAQAKARGRDRVVYLSDDSNVKGETDNMIMTAS